MTGDAVVEVSGDHPRQISSGHDASVDLSLVIPTYDEARKKNPSDFKKLGLFA